MLATIIATGDELISGKVADTNGALLASELSALGFRVRCITQVGDSPEEIASAINDAVSRSALVITTGGLGPTTDDLTRDVIALSCKTKTVLNEDALRKLKEFSAKRGRPFAEINARQAYFPENAEIIPNAGGTADAFFVRHPSGAHIVALPGVPFEVKVILEQELKRRLRGMFDLREQPATVLLKIFGLSESFVGSVIEAAHLGAEINGAYRPRFPEIWVTLTCRSACEPPQAAKLVAAAAKAVSEAIGEQFIFTTAVDESFPAVIGGYLTQRSERVAVAESCTGGRISDLIVSVPGASEFFTCGLVAYANESKEAFLGVHAQSIEHYGAVGKETAVEMARGVRIRSGSEIGISTTGIAGPTGGSDSKPVGTVWIALSTIDKEVAFSYRLLWERDRFRLYASYLALDLLRRHLLGLPLEYERR